MPSEKNEKQKNEKKWGLFKRPLIQYQIYYHSHQMSPRMWRQKEMGWEHIWRHNSCKTSLTWGRKQSPKSRKQTESQTGLDQTGIHHETLYFKWQKLQIKRSKRKATNNVQGNCLVVNYQLPVSWNSADQKHVAHTFKMMKGKIYNQQHSTWQGSHSDLMDRVKVL